jgi:hypothetical protein
VRTRPGLQNEGRKFVRSLLEYVRSIRRCARYSSGPRSLGWKIHESASDARLVGECGSRVFPITQTS